MLKATGSLLQNSDDINETFFLILCNYFSSYGVTQYTQIYAGLKNTSPGRWLITPALKKNAKAVPLHSTKALVVEEYSCYSLSTSALDGGEWSASRPGRALTPGKGPPVSIVQEGAWVGLRAGLNTEARGKILFLCRGSNLDRPVVQPVARQ
jgi:hypothetical protein